MPWDILLMKVLIKKKFVDLMNSARDPLKKHETLFQKKKKKKGEMQIADTGHDCYIQMDI